MRRFSCKTVTLFVLSYRFRNKDVSALLAEEVLHELSALFFQNAISNRSFGVQGAWRIELVAALLVATAIDDAWHLCPSSGAGTHGAGLYGYIECTVCQVFPPQRVGSSGDGLHLSVGGHVAERFRQVV